MKLSSGAKPGREPLTHLEASRERLAQMREAAAAARREAAPAAHNSGSVLPAGSRGRPAEPGSRRDVARRTGISPREQVRVERHTTLGTQYPMFENACWKMATALKAGCLLEALTPDQRLKVLSELAELDPPSALRLLRTVINSARAVVPVRAAPAPATQSPAAKESAAAMKGTTPAVGVGAGAAVARLLLKAKLLVLHAGKRPADPPLHARLRRVAGELDAVLVQLRRGAPATTSPMLGDMPTDSVPRALLNAKALVIEAAQICSDPTLHGRLLRVAADLNAVLLELQPRR